MTQVFISYSRKDLAFVEVLAKDLKAAGLETWYDLSGLEGGARWGQDIQAAIEASQIFVVVLSPNSIASQWVEREFMYADSLKKKIVPLLYQPCKTPMWFINLHFIDVQGENYDRNWWVILKAMGVKMSEQKNGSEPSEQTASPRRASTGQIHSIQSVGVEEQKPRLPLHKIKIIPGLIFALAGLAAVASLVLWGLPLLAARRAPTFTPVATGISTLASASNAAATSTFTSASTAQTANTPTFTPIPTATVGSSQLDVFWWLDPGVSQPACWTALIHLFNQQYPAVKFINAAIGGNSTNGDELLASRLASNDIPDSWSNVDGPKIYAYAAAGTLQPLDDLFAATGLDQTLPANLLPFISYRGHPYLIPLSVNRMNVMWYNPKVLAAAGITANPKTDFKTWDDFFTVCDKIKAAGKTCLSLGPPWTAEILFENVMLGTLGPAKWNGLWNTPPGTDWAGPDVTAGINNFARVLSYTNANASTLPDGTTASRMVRDGSAAFNIMADWAYTDISTSSNGLALKPHTDFDWAAVPGTYGVFGLLSNGFVLPTAAKHPDATTAWLKVAASRSGQEAYNLSNGTICARMDCDQAQFNDFSQENARDWTSDVLASDIISNLAGAQDWTNAILGGITSFQSDTSRIADFQTSLVAACRQLGTCK